MVIVLLYNRDAGQQPFPSIRQPVGDPAWLSDTLAYLRARGAAVEAVASESPEEATRAARRAALDGADLVIAAGGDGTLRAAADGLAETKTPLGILPRGTANVLAREFAIPLIDPQAACDICLGGLTRRIDLGRIGGSSSAARTAARHFLLMASVGVDAATVANVNTDMKGIMGAHAYVLSGLATLATYHPTDLILTLDGETRRASAFMAVIANAPSYGGDFKVAPLASMDDGWLDVCLFEAPDTPPSLQKASFLRQIGAVALNRHLLDIDFHYYRARRIEIASEPEAAVQIDGDILGTTSVCIEIVPQALSVRVPS